MRRGGAQERGWRLAWEVSGRRIGATESASHLANNAQGPCQRTGSRTCVASREGGSGPRRRWRWRGRRSARDCRLDGSTCTRVHRHLRRKTSEELRLDEKYGNAAAQPAHRHPATPPITRTRRTPPCGCGQAQSPAARHRATRGEAPCVLPRTRPRER